MTGVFVVYVAVGKLLIYIGQKFLADNFRNKFLHKLFECDLCLGVWVYVILALCFKMMILQDILPYVPFVTEVITGIVTSFLMHLLSIGYREKFSVIIV